MNKNKKNGLIILIILVIIIGITSVVLNVINEEDLFTTNDAAEFIEEYESYNEVATADSEYLSLDLNDEAVIYITSIDDIVDVMQNEDAIIYFGFATCPWCRAMISVLLDAAVENNQAIYYVDISEVRNTYSVENGLIYESTEGDEAYYEVLELLGDNASEYYVEDDESNVYDTNTTRVFGPTVVTVKEGKLLDITINPVSDVEDKYTPISDEKYNELLDLFDGMIDELQSTSCSLEGC